MSSIRVHFSGLVQTLATESNFHSCAHGGRLGSKHGSPPAPQPPDPFLGIPVAVGSQLSISPRSSCCREGEPRTPPHSPDGAAGEQQHSEEQDQPHGQLGEMKERCRRG